LAATILLIRHAAHDDLNVRLSGRRPGVPLSAAGRAQAKRVGHRLANHGIVRVACSPLQRTVETAAAITGAASLPDAEPDDALLEIDFGAWTGRTFDSLTGDSEWDRWNAERLRATPPQGEAMAAAQQRIVGWLDATARSVNGAVVAAVTHCDMIRAAVAHVLGLPLDKLLRFDIDTASITTIVAGDWGARLVRLNDKGD
jgi:broad specificity phosphatase PhoE